jgi:hypothetical protein
VSRYNQRKYEVLENMIKIKHWIVIRFNLGLYKTGKNPEEWFEKRIKIFREFTIPSLRRQSYRDFTIAVLYDESTPKHHIAKFDFPDKNIVLVPIKISETWKPKNYGERASIDINYSPFVDMIRHDSKIIIQTRLDNDDALMPCAIEKIRENIEARSDSYLIDFEDGYIIDYQEKKAFEAHHYLGSPFVSLVQTSSPKIKSIYSLIHKRMTLVYHTKGCPGRIWIMNIHGNNCSNRMFDWMVKDSVDYDELIREIQ